MSSAFESPASTCNSSSSKLCIWTSAPNSRAIIVAVSVSSAELIVSISRFISSLARTSLTRRTGLSARSLTVIPSASVIVLVTGGGAAFTLMRARGAKVTDIVVLVVAADDGVMPQTKEAIDHAKAANVPIVVAVNKIDKADANPERVKRELSELGLMPEAWGGTTVTVDVSARQRKNLDQLLEMILLVADLADLKANPKRKATGTVLESKLDRGRGPVATVLVQDGTLQEGDLFIAGTVDGKG